MAHQRWNRSHLFLAFVIVVSKDIGGVDLALNRNGSTFESVNALRNSIFSTENRSTAVRPIANQSDSIVIYGLFELVSILSLDDVKQELITNGYIFLFWHDEIRYWDEDQYGVDELEIRAEEVWRPRLSILNSVRVRDAFHDHESYTSISSDGVINWMPGGLFHTFCELNLKDFPFDVQTCKQQLCPISHVHKNVEFEMMGPVRKDFYFPNSGWTLLDSNVTTENKYIFENVSFSCPTIYYTLKRRPINILLNVIIPVILLSLLNNFVFLIPLESGENIGYAITVLLAMTVFLGMVSSMTPQVTNVIPSLTIYLFTLLVTSVITVAVVIFTERLHHREEMDSMKHLDTNNDGTATSNQDLSDTTTVSVSINTSKGYQGIARRINLVFFVFVMGIWSGATLWYFISTNASF